MGAVRLLLDTHTLIWAVSGASYLSAPARDAIDDPGNEVMVSAVSAWEAATKHRLGRLESGDLVVSQFSEIVRELRASELAVTVTHGLVAGGFSVDHRDPFDRMLAAQALLERAALVTSDQAFRQFPVEVLW